MKSILKKELKQMFSSPAYFIIIAVFIGILNFLFLKGFFVDSIMDFRNYFSLEIWFLMIFIPALSMRIMSEEFKNNSIEFLLTKPISILKVLGGKYFSLIIYFSIVILSSIILYISLLFFGSFPSGIIFSQIIGSILLIFAMFSVSFLASNITKNQVFAFLLGVLINFLLIIIGTDFIQLSLPYFFANFLNGLSFFSHADNFSKGIISIGDILYFLSIIFFSLYLSYVSLNNFKKSGKVGLQIVSLTELLIILVILIFSNIIISSANLFFDLTPNSIYTLSDSTKDILKNINDRVNINLYVSKELPPQLKIPYTRVKDTITQFNKYAGNNIYLTEVNPIEDNKEQEALENGISPIQIQTLKDDQYATQKGYLGLSIKYIDKQEVIPYLGNTDNLEYSLISKILKLTNKNKKQVSLIYSDDIDNQIISIMNNVLNENYDVIPEKISSNTQKIYSENSDVYLILEGDNKFGTGVVEQIEGNLDKKPILYFFQPIKVDTKMGLLATKNESQLSKDILGKFDLKLGSLVGDAKHNSTINLSQGYITYRLPYPLFPKVVSNPDLPISEGISNIITPFISTFETSGSGKIDIKDLFTTSEFGFENKSLEKIIPNDLEKITKDDFKKLSLAKMINSGTTKIALIPNTYMFTMGGQDSLLNNFKLVSNLTDYLGGDSRLINIRSKSINYNNFIAEKTPKNIIKGLNIFGLPILLLILGIGIAFFRNKKRS